MGGTIRSLALSQQTPHPETPATAFFPVSIDALHARQLELDLYMIHAGKDPVLYRSVGSPYTPGDTNNLAEQGVAWLYVPTGQHRVFQRILTENLVRAYEDAALPPDERCGVVRSSCARLIHDLMRYPTIPGITETLGEICGYFSMWCADDLDRFAELLDLSARDYESTTHMVNVGVGCGLLWREFKGPDPERLREVFQGGLLHDIGKRAIPDDVIHREGKLDDDAWAMIRDHPITGAELLARHKGISHAAMDMVRDHHERPDGCGFPRGIKAHEIGVPARVCAIVDTFDSLTTARKHRDPLPPVRVLASLREEAGTLFDTGALDAWDRTIQRLIQRHPERCVPDSAGIDTPKLRLIVPSAPKQAIPRSPDAVVGPGARERECDIPVRIARAGGATGEPARLVAIGPGRVRLVLSGAPLRVGERCRLLMEGRPGVEVIVGHHHFGPGGEVILECETMRRGRAA